MQNLLRQGKKLTELLADTKFFTYQIICLMILLIIGTIAQKDIGLYLAHQKYFASFIVTFFGFVPFPGGYTLLSLMTIGLILKLITDPLKISKIGVTISHLGVLALLIGAGISSISSSEGNMIIKEKGYSNVVNDYFANEIVIYNLEDDEQNIIYKTSFEKLKITDIIANDNMPFQIKIREKFINTDLIKRSEAGDDLQGFAKIFKLTSKKSENNYEENIASISFEIIEDGISKGFYSIFELMPIKQTFMINNKQYQIEIQKQQSILPFKLSLDRFEKTTYPGTEKAKSYKSYLTISDQNLAWKAEISMNKPLRYKSYSFYQSSYINDDGTIYSVLAVVKNAGRLFPYISTIIIAFGILLHLIQRIRSRNV